MHAILQPALPQQPLHLRDLLANGCRRRADGDKAKICDACRRRWQRCRVGHFCVGVGFDILVGVGCWFVCSSCGVSDWPGEGWEDLGDDDMTWWGCGDIRGSATTIACVRTDSTPTIRRDEHICKFTQSDAEVCARSDWIGVSVSSLHTSLYAHIAIYITPTRALTRLPDLSHVLKQVRQSSPRLLSAGLDLRSRQHETVRTGIAQLNRHRVLDLRILSRIVYT